MGGDTDWLRSIGPYNGPLASDQSGTTFAEDYALRAAENSFPFTVPIPQVVVNANLTPEQRIASKFGINSYSWAGPEVEASPFEFRSLFGDAYRNAAHEALSSENSWGVRAGYAASAAVLALPGLANDMARDVLNAPSWLYRGSGEMSRGIKAGDPYQFSEGLMKTSMGVLALAGGASVIKSGILANVSSGAYAASQTVARTSYSVASPFENIGALPTGSGMTKLDLAAEEAYQRIRSVGMSDVQAVADNTGLSLSDATTMKKHLFFGRHEYPIDGETVVRNRFAADHEISFAWQTAAAQPLSEGQANWFSQLAQHELAERRFMAQGIPYLQREAWTGSYFGTTPPGAHNLAPMPPRTTFPGYKIPSSLLEW